MGPTGSQSSSRSFSSSWTSYGGLLLSYLLSLRSHTRRGLAISWMVLCLLSLQCCSGVVSSAAVAGVKDGMPRNAASGRKVLAQAVSAEDKLAAAITAANAGSTAEYVLNEDVVLTKALPWIQKSFSIKGGTCGSGTNTRRCFIDGAKKFPIFVSYALPCTVVMVNVELRNALGGAAYLKSCAVTLEGCLFVNNTADFGAALYMGLGGQRFNVRSTGFIGNKATTSGGGAISISARQGGEFTKCVFSGNSAKGSGGAIAHFSGTSPVVISECNFTGNSASGGGGAVWIDPNVPTVGDVFFLSTSFTKNKAINSMGGAVGLEHILKGHFCGCTFSGNSGSRGGANIVLIGSSSLGESLYVNFCPNRPAGVLLKPHPRYVSTIDSCIPCAP